MVLGWSELPSDCGYSGNSLPRTGYGGNGHREDAAGGQQLLFAWAEFLAQEPAETRARNGKPKPLVAAPVRVGAWQKAGT